MSRSVHSTNSTLNVANYRSQLNVQNREAIRRVVVRNVNAFQAFHIIGKFVDLHGKDGVTLKQDEELIRVQFILDDCVIEMFYDQDISRLDIWTEWD